MALKEPESMDELVYFTRRKTEYGRTMAWVFRENCEKCKKGLMEKPRDNKGKVKTRAKEYVCPECGYTVGAKEHEDSLTVNIKYTCGNCDNEGETQIPYKRKTFKGVKALVFQCDNCDEKIPITKKLKEPKVKK